MSNIGLNANIYHITGKYLNLLNTFVAKSKIHQSESENPGIKDVITFFTKLQTEDIIDPQIQLLSSIVEGELRQHKQIPQTFFSDLLHNLADNNFKDSLPKIELVIGALDNEHFEALSKIKGNR
jgi:hypothetical protein